MTGKFKALKDKFEALASAVAFAEAGEFDTAEAILDELWVVKENHHPKLLLVAVNGGFTESAIDYAVNLASRMAYDILAMNIFQVSPVKKVFRKNQGQQNKHLFQESKSTFELLKEKTFENGIQCDHMIIFEDLQAMIHKVQRLIKRIEFILIQSEKQEKMIPDLGIPVFMIVPENT